MVVREREGRRAQGTNTIVEMLHPVDFIAETALNLHFKLDNVTRFTATRDTEMYGRAVGCWASVGAVSVVNFR